jgi:hypothetical protein
MIVLILFLIEIEYLFGGNNYRFFCLYFEILFNSRLQLTTKMASEHKPGGHKLWHAMYMARKLINYEFQD